MVGLKNLTYWPREVTRQVRCFLEKLRHGFDIQNPYLKHERKIQVWWCVLVIPELVRQSGRSLELLDKLL